MSDGSLLITTTLVTPRPESSRGALCTLPSKTQVAASLSVHPVRQKKNPCHERAGPEGNEHQRQREVQPSAAGPAREVHHRQQYRRRDGEPEVQPQRLPGGVVEVVEHVRLDEPDEQLQPEHG